MTRSTLASCPRFQGTARFPALLGSLAIASAAFAQAPDLVVHHVHAHALAGDWQALTVAGTVDVEIENLGNGASGAFDVLIFEDGNGSGAFEPFFDVVLGGAAVGGFAAGELRFETVAVAGPVTFRGNLVHAFADSAGAVAESDETNNVGHSGSTCQLAPTVGQIDPQLEWSWTSTAIDPASLNVMMTPAVVDLDGDQVPEIVFASTASTGGGLVEVGILRALHGADGSEYFNVTDPTLRVNTATSVAVGDIDLDGSPEIVACDSTGARLICFEHDGTFKWRSATLEAIHWGAPAIADLDQDGTPEIVVGRQALDANGVVLWTGTGGAAGAYPGPLSLVSDVDGDGAPEVVAGNTIYSASGAIEHTAPVTDGPCAVANLDADPYAELVVVAGGMVTVCDLTPGVTAMTVKAGWPAAIPGGGAGGPPTVANYDADPEREIGVAGAVRYAVFEADGSLKWQSATQDGSSNRTGSSVFDFDGDGAAEAVYRDELELRVYRGTDGLILWETPMSSCTWFEYVLVADCDADGNAEIVAVANNNCGFGSQRGVWVFGSASDSWVPTRRVWNEHTYHITNVAEDGAIPAVEPVNWLSPSASPYNNFRQNVLNAAVPNPAPDATASRITANVSAVPPTVGARIGNGGAALIGIGLPVAFYDGDPSAGGQLLGTTALSVVLQPGRYEDVALALPGAVPAIVWAVADDSGGGIGTQNECDETNNAHSAAVGVTLDCPADVVEIWTTGPPQQVDPTHTGFASWTDTCDPNAVLGYSDVFDPGNAPGEPETIVTRTWTLADVCGNQLSCVQRITLLSPSLGHVNLELDTTTCADLISRSSHAPRIEIVLLGQPGLAAPNVQFATLRLARRDYPDIRIAPLARRPASDEAIYAAQVLGDCNPAGQDGRNDLRLEFDRDELIYTFGLDLLPRGSDVYFVLTGKRANGTTFYATTVAKLR